MSTIPFQEWAHVSSHDAQLTIPPPAVPPPSLRPLHQPPPLNASGTGVRPQVAEFTQWAARSLKEEEEDIRLALLQVRGRPEFIEAFEAEVTEARASDWTHAFLALSLLGSIRDATTEPYLIALAREAGPTSGTFLSDGALPDNVPLEATYLAMLQSVAVDALVLLDSQTAKAEIRRIAREHESRLVRAEAIRAYVLRFEAAGRAELEREIRADDMWHLDRFENVNIDGGPSFDTRLSGYISSHPEVMTYESEAQ